MTKRQSHSNNGLESPAPDHRQREEEEQAATRPTTVSTDREPKVEEGAPQKLNDSSNQEDRGASDALMESYNG